MQTETQDPSPQAQTQGEDIQDWQGNGGKGAESALARMKQQERNRAWLRTTDLEGSASPRE